VGHVSEAEILSLLKQTFRRAAEHCDKLSILPARGPTYRKLREDLQTAENCCRQVAWYRQDTRWLRVGRQMDEAHKRAGSWLRDRSMPRTANSNLAHPLFVLLAEKLRFGMACAGRLETQATGQAGTILPDVPRDPIRTQDRVVQVHRKTAGGIIIPPGVAA
jgi:hypothetical protein